MNWNKWLLTFAMLFVAIFNPVALIVFSGDFEMAVASIVWITFPCGLIVIILHALDPTAKKETTKQ